MKNKETFEVNEARVRMKNSCGEFGEGKREGAEGGILGAQKGGQVRRRGW